MYVQCWCDRVSAFRELPSPLCPRFLSFSSFIWGESTRVWSRPTSVCYSFPVIHYRAVVITIVRYNIVISRSTDQLANGYQNNRPRTRLNRVEIKKTALDPNLSDNRSNVVFDHWKILRVNFCTRAPASLDENFCFRQFQFQGCSCIINVLYTSQKRWFGILLDVAPIWKL